MKILLNKTTCGSYKQYMGPTDKDANTLKFHFSLIQMVTKKQKKPSVLCRIKNHLQVSISSIQKNHLQAKCMGNHQ